MTSSDSILSTIQIIKVDYFTLAYLSTLKYCNIESNIDEIIEKQDKKYMKL